MNSFPKFLISLLIIIFSVINILHAQTISKNNFEIGLGLGTTIYQGDIEPGALGSYKRLQPSFSLYAGKWVNQFFLIQATFTHAEITAHDSDWAQPAFKKMRNLNFSTSINEINARIVFSPFGNINYTPDKRWYPYAFAGIGAAFTHINRDWSGIDSSFLNLKNQQHLSLDSAHRLPSSIPSVPLGAGIRYMISPNISLFGEVTYRLPVTDYLDGFSYLGNTNRKDNYYNYSIGINFSLSDDKSRCPKAKQ